MPMPEDGLAESPAEVIGGASAPMPRFRAALAIVAAMAIIGLGTLTGVLAGYVFDLANGVDHPRAYGAGGQQALTTARLASFLMVFQVTSLALTMAVSPWFSAAHPHQRLLPFVWPKGGLKTIVISVVTMIALAGLYGLVVYIFDHNAAVRDLRPFSELMRAESWWLILLAAAIGAPLAEETVFRGLLYGVLRTTAAGIPGAALISAVMWSAMHGNYSMYGLGAIFLIGLYLAWLREKTGSLIAPIVCHGVYNALIVLVIATAPERPFQASG